MQVKLKLGERVKHETKTEWGIGEVLADESNGKVRIFFEDVGAKVFDLSHPGANFVKLSHEESDSDYLSALVKYYQAELAKPTSLKKSDSKFTSDKNAIQIFLSYFSSGFQDCKYLDGRDGERGYKVAANQLMIELLDQDIFKILLDKGEFEEICSRAKRIVSKTNLINRYEIIWLSNGISIEGNQQAFAESLFDLLYGKNEIKDRFERFSNLLSKIGAAKWPIATYFLYIRFPESQIFIKPVVTQNAANILNLEINYKPELNWLTYSQVLVLAERIRMELLKDGRSILVPRDMIDVQSFIWIIAPGYAKDVVRTP